MNFLSPLYSEHFFQIHTELFGVYDEHDLPLGSGPRVHPVGGHVPIVLAQGGHSDWLRPLSPTFHFGEGLPS